MGPFMQTRRQLALVRKILESEPPERPSSLRRRFRNSHETNPHSFAQHFGSVWSAHKKMCRSIFPMLRASEQWDKSAVIFMLDFFMQAAAMIISNNFQRVLLDNLWRSEPLSVAATHDRFRSFFVIRER